MSTHVLLIGSGGREHALAWKLAQSPELGNFFAAPGNPGIAAYATCVSLDPFDHAAVVDFARENAIGLVVVGPEAPLVAGLADALDAAGVPVFGPSAAAAQLEGSKGFTKDLCAEQNIPTARYERFADRDAALEYVAQRGVPIVIKADGLAAGKGVTVAQTLDEALAAVEGCFEAEGAEIVVEECLEGEEASLFCLCDGKGALFFGTAQDHKRAFDRDRGPNTGGMGAYSPAINLSPEATRRAMREIVEPTLKGMAARGTPFRGVLYAGLMLTDKGPQLIEYNVRFGDPEAQVLMMRLESDLLPILLACAKGDLSGVEPRWRDDRALTVVMATEGYPGAYPKGTPIGPLPEPRDDLVVFHAGTKLGADGTLLSDGGRVLNVTARGPTVREAARIAYGAIEAIDWPSGFWRSDIGHAAIMREDV
ncbi:phosphoribosylamine--glycine ligase [Antarcticirhabdus aurantiaca]|uniref:Phosphoribosylamine--glycine ligase n=1 Tax=Antarcticirhabdus aurantiaca TaxID=2606717 RepID=A0ACD4NS99_9HYPH|nr:phosphoribosylamine--glycine ligase [Antarcticirhabdus aurantiaca]WAJ29804.1 phosphoribosylamine--glycine ligase [Jeongeuplla avenae]